MFNILVCEDDKSIRRLMCEYLKKDRYNTYEAIDGENALEVLDTNQIDLIITDIMMPKIDGIELTKELRNAEYEIPILMVTAKETIEDKKKGFSAGSDDYMVKPIDMDEMLIRVSALLRRAKIAHDKKIEIGNVQINFDSLTVKAEDKVLVLPKKEFLILFKLLSTPNKIFTRMQLMDEIWGYDVESDERTVDVHIKRLREKLVFIKEFDIITVRGIGYKAVKNS